MKRFLCLLSSAIFLLSVASCKNDEADDPKGQILTVNSKDFSGNPEGWYISKVALFLDGATVLPISESPWENGFSLELKNISSGKVLKNLSDVFRMLDEGYKNVWVSDPKARIGKTTIVTFNEHNAANGNIILGKRTSTENIMVNYYWSDRAVTIKGVNSVSYISGGIEMTSQYTYDLNLNKGWNRISKKTFQIGNIFYSVETTFIPSGLSWDYYSAG